MNRRFQFAVVASSSCLVGLLLFGAVRGRSESSDNTYTHLGVYSEVLSRIKSDYVEEPNMKAVTEGAINGMLEALDPYASYLNADQYQQYLKSKNAPKAQVGLVLSRRYGYLSVVDALPGSPAAKAGMSTGDVIESINKVATRDMPLAFADILLSGEPGTSVEMSVLRVRKSEPQTLTLTRTNPVYPPVSGKLVTEQGQQVGVIQTYSLAPGRAKDIAAQIDALTKQGAQRFVLDLRHCSTGDYEEGIAVANLFMDKGLITYLQGQKVSRQDFDAAASKQVTKAPLVVLVNRGTAGAAEITAAALLDSKRADVVGEHTYGDAGVRKAVTMDDGSAVILSVAKYYAPDGKAIQDTGVAPNVQQDEMMASDDDDSDTPSTGPAPVDSIMQKGLDRVRVITTLKN
ncbi:MAG TPA: S41 family peptidase [Bryobacteraceae bacterium]|nr:S41 family peptidase [Bryobacteraceae bacterium]